jgi:hypothetical protein|tara:strand:+ start:273 stop:746 length:474 start_codon:yes stop_codon:yes gene_type:complete
MKSIIYTKLLFVFLLSIFLSCGTEEIPPDKLIGEWTVYSITDDEQTVIIWNDLKTSLVDLIPEYSCLDFTASATAQLVTTRYTFVDVNSRGCLSPAIAAYTWLIDPETGFYQFTQGNNIINYSISFSNNDNRMTWIDQTSGTTTVWDRVVSVEVTSE